MNREDDIIALAKGVLATKAIYDEKYNSRSPDTFVCPFCGQEEWEVNCKEDHEMESIEHELNCPYLIAKDLLTGIK